MEFKDLVDRDQIVVPGVSAALGAAVSHRAMGNLTRHFLGVVVEVMPDRRSVWVRRFHDDADTSVWYAVRDLELATTEDLVEAGRYFLNRQYREVGELRKAVAS